MTPNDTNVLETESGIIWAALTYYADMVRRAGGPDKLIRKAEKLATQYRDYTEEELSDE